MIFNCCNYDFRCPILNLLKRLLLFILNFFKFSLLPVGFSVYKLCFGQKYSVVFYPGMFWNTEFVCFSSLDMFLVFWKSNILKVMLMCVRKLSTFQRTYRRHILAILQVLLLQSLWFLSQTTSYGYYQWKNKHYVGSSLIILWLPLLVAPFYLSKSIQQCGSQYYHDTR